MEKEERVVRSRSDILDTVKTALFIIGVSSLAVALIVLLKFRLDDSRTRRITEELMQRSGIEHAESQQGVGTPYTPADAQPTGGTVEEVPPAEMLPEYASLYAENPELAGWLWIEGTKIDYPVMQSPERPWYYIHRDFYGKDNSNGSLFADEACVIGSGTAAKAYADGTHPGANVMIYGHRMGNGEMFGTLGKWRDQNYAREHSIICFDSLYEHRKYQVMAVFISRIYNSDEDAFKYYQFFVADSEREFNEFYESVKALSFFDFGVEASYGDEFITLSTCDYWTDDGRLVVVGKRIE
ncbi:MAG: class B sortase [Lachnospiraceae bacterium]|nr:class B sortase [Lachnospiraceae bacterium]